MSMSRKEKEDLDNYLTTDPRDYDPKIGFPVMCEIGFLEFGGDTDPVEAAFVMIARHGASGRFTFPHPEETRTISVTVTGIKGGN